MFRLDRFLSLYFFHPLTKRRPASDIKVPILMYHGISLAKRHNGHPYYETTTSPVVFAEQLGYLKSNGYKTIGLKDLPAVFSGQVGQAEKHVVITFDDGLMDFCVTGFPILKEHGFCATVFLPAGLMGGKLAGQDVMSWEDAKKLSAEGVVFGSHSLTHLKLVDLDQKRLQKEIKESKVKIEKELSRNIDSFSYPFAFPEENQNFLAQYKSLLIDSGYRTGVTTIVGHASSADDRYILKRLPINMHDDIKFFIANLEKGYDWIHSIQKLSKIIKKVVHRRNLAQ